MRGIGDQPVGIHDDQALRLRHERETGARGRRRADLDDQLGHVGGEERVARQEERSGGERTGDPKARRRLGDQGPAEGARQLHDRGGVLTERPGNDDPSLHFLHLLGELLDVRAPGSSLGTGRPGRERVVMADLGLVPRRRQGIAERHVHVRGAGGVSAGDLGSLQSYPEPVRRVGGVAGHASVDEPLHVSTEQIPLIDGLVRAHPVKLGRAVGREEHEWRARRRCLDHRGEQVRGGGPRGARHGHRPPRRLGQAEREERRGPLIEMNVDRHARVTRQREREGGRAGARRNARMLEPVRHEPVDERAHARERDVSF